MNRAKLQHQRWCELPQKKKKKKKMVRGCMPLLPQCLCPASCCPPPLSDASTAGCSLKATVVHSKSESEKNATKQPINGWTATSGAERHPHPSLTQQNGSSFLSSLHERRRCFTVIISSQPHRSQASKNISLFSYRELPFPTTQSIDLTV